MECKRRSIKHEKVRYVCLSKKDKKDLKIWKNNNKSSNRKKSSKAKAIKSSHTEKSKTSYKQFLKSDYWKEVRYKVLERDNFKCKWCGDNKRLEVHHTTYKNHFKEHLFLDDLVTLCRNCHSEYHKN